MPTYTIAIIFALLTHLIIALACHSTPQPPAKALNVYTNGSLSENCVSENMVDVASNILSIAKNLSCMAFQYFTMKDPGMDRYFWMDTNKSEWSTSLLGEIKKKNIFEIALNAKGITIGYAQINGPQPNIHRDVYVIGEFKYKVMVQHKKDKKRVTVLHTWNYGVPDIFATQPLPYDHDVIRDAVLKGFITAIANAECRLT